MSCTLSTKRVRFKPSCIDNNKAVDSEAKQSDELSMKRKLYIQNGNESESEKGQHLIKRVRFHDDGYDDDNNYNRFMKKNAVYSEKKVTDHKDTCDSFQVREQTILKIKNSDKECDDCSTKFNLAKYQAAPWTELTCVSRILCDIVQNYIKEQNSKKENFLSRGEEMFLVALQEAVTSQSDEQSLLAFTNITLKDNVKRAKFELRDALDDMLVLKLQEQKIKRDIIQLENESNVLDEEQRAMKSSFDLLHTLRHFST